MKGNTKLMTVTAFAMISLLAMLILTLNLQAKAQQAQNQTSPISQVQNKLGALVEKFRVLVTKSGSNITLPQSGNLADQLRNLTQSSGFKKLSQLLPELSELGINETAIKNLQQKGGTDLPGIVQKLKDLYQVIP
jgi:predicted PurR-regulated permease PerM